MNDDATHTIDENGGKQHEQHYQADNSFEMSNMRTLLAKLYKRNKRLLSQVRSYKHTMNDCSHCRSREHDAAHDDDDENDEAEIDASVDILRLKSPSSSSKVREEKQEDVRGSHRLLQLVHAREAMITSLQADLQKVRRVSNSFVGRHITECLTHTHPFSPLCLLVSNGNRDDDIDDGRLDAICFQC